MGIVTRVVRALLYFQCVYMSGVKLDKALVKGAAEEVIGNGASTLLQPCMPYACLTGDFTWIGTAVITGPIALASQVENATVTTTYIESITS